MTSDPFLLQTPAHHQPKTPSWLRLSSSPPSPTPKEEHNVHNKPSQLNRDDYKLFFFHLASNSVIEGERPGAGEVPLIWGRSNTLILLTLLTFLIYGGYGLIQEWIFRVPGFHFSWFLTFVQTFSYMSLSYLENAIGREGGEGGEGRTSSSYLFLLAFSIVAATGFSNLALEYLNYPTQILFKSSKLIPVMIGSTLILRKSYRFLEYFAAFLLCLGIAGFTLADFKVLPSFNPLGVFLISLGLIADAFVGPIQERALHVHKSSLHDVIFQSYSKSCLILLVLMLMTGELFEAFRFLQLHPDVLFWLIILGLFSYAGLRVVLLLLNIYGAVIATIVTSCRKITTIILSFLFFPKPFTWVYLIAGASAFLGLTLQAYVSNQKQWDNAAEKFKRRLKQLFQ